MNNFAIQGHPTGIQYMNRMMGGNGVTTEEIVSTDIPLSDSDIEIEDVAPKKNEVPFFTKKGKFIIATIIVGSALYYIWQKHKASKEQASQPQTQPEAKPTETEKAVAVESAVSNESGTEGVDL
jgi:hypothetical protein